MSLCWLVVMGTGWLGTEAMAVFTLGPVEDAVGHTGSGGLVSNPTSGARMCRTIDI